MSYSKRICPVIVDLRSAAAQPSSVPAPVDQLFNSADHALLFCQMRSLMVTKVLDTCTIGKNKVAEDDFTLVGSTHQGNPCEGDGRRRERAVDGPTLAGRGSWPIY